MKPTFKIFFIICVCSINLISLMYFKPYWQTLQMYTLEECMPPHSDSTLYNSVNCAIECDYYAFAGKICYHRWIPV